MKNKTIKNRILKPIVLINAGTHGTEKVGVKIIKSIKNIKVIKGSVVFSVAHQKALLKNKRFFETDLNRSFPGKINGSLEERLAYKLLPKIKSADIVIDIHSTESGLTSSVIITKLTRQTIDLAQSTNARHVLYMEATKNNAFISSAKAGIGLEFGKDKSPKTFHDTKKAVLLVLKKFGMVSGIKAEPQRKKLYFHVLGPVLKPKGFKLSSKVRNFKLIKKGEIYATNKKDSKLKADMDFYPILFGEKRYKDIFGFKAYKLSKFKLQKIK